MGAFFKRRDVEPGRGRRRIRRCNTGRRDAIKSATREPSMPLKQRHSLRTLNIDSQRLRREGVVRHCQGMVLCDWAATAADGQQKARGTNVFVLGPTGKIEWVTGFWAPPVNQASK